MKAFLSHSSKDKWFVGKIFDELGPILSEYDEVTFDYTFNVQAIRDSLVRCSLFVYFLSKDSISSTFVNEEKRAALEARGAGFIKKILVFATDETSYRALPQWMKETNIVQRLSSAKSCARRIESVLFSQEAEAQDNDAVYLGRDRDEKALRSALIVTPSKIPLALHAVGHHGIGRRTFLRNALSKVLPKHYSIFVELGFDKHDGIEEFYRRLYNLHIVSSLSETIDRFEKFSHMSEDGQVGEVLSIISEMADDGEFIVIVDDGGVYTEDGDYHPFFKKIIEGLNKYKRPILGVAQTRMMPQRLRSGYNRSFHQYLEPLDDGSVKEIIAFGFQEFEIDYSPDELEDLVQLVDGHPFNIRFALQYVVTYGIQSLLDDPSDLVSWKQRRAEDYLGKIDFTEIEGDLIAVISDYRHVAPDMIADILSHPVPEIRAALRRLQEFCCVEFREGYFHISAPIRDAVSKDDRFDRPSEWKRKVAAAICDAIKNYQDDDQVSVPIIETAIIAAAKGEVAAPLFLSHLILPSHVLRIARDHYDGRRWGRCQEFAQRAFEAKSRLPLDAQVEALRLWGLSSVRTDDDPAYQKVLEFLRDYRSNYAKRVGQFLRGFYFRVQGRLDEAEPHFLAAWKLAKKNESINRELAILYCRQARYSEAEPFARAAYENAPNSPYILDVMAETLLGKQQYGGRVDAEDLKKVLKNLQIYGDAPGSSFYLNRVAQENLKDGDKRGALESVNRAIARTPSLLPPYFMRSDICLALGDTTGAERDLEKINGLLTQAGGYSEGDEARAAELEIKIRIERGRFGEAKQAIEKSAFLPSAVQRRLLDRLARSIAFSPENVDPKLTTWANGHRQRSPK